MYKKKFQDIRSKYSRHLGYLKKSFQIGLFALPGGSIYLSVYLITKNSINKFNQKKKNKLERELDDFQ